MAVGIDKIIEIFGAKVDWNEDFEIAQAGLVDAIWARNNPDRLFLAFINLSASNVFIRPGQAATTTTGILLVPLGGFFSVIIRDDAILPIIEWHVVGAVDNLDIYTLEVVGVERVGRPSE